MSEPQWGEATKTFIKMHEAAKIGHKEAIDWVRDICIKAATDAPVDDLLSYIAPALIQMQKDYYSGLRN